MPVSLSFFGHLSFINLFRTFISLAQAERRKKEINELMWNDKLKFFFDYNKNRKQQNHFYSVAGFYPMWAGLASQEQADLIRLHVLPMLEYEGGISNTQSSGLSPDTKQHDHPNGWPHQQYIVVKGLLNYGFTADAERIARKWVDMNVKIFHETGKFWEKYDVVTRNIGVFNPDRYPTQSGFGWTNAIFLRLVKELNLDELRREEKPVLKEEKPVSKEKEVAHKVKKIKTKKKAKTAA